MREHIDNYTFLTEAPVRKVILIMAVPTIITMLVSSLYNIADTFFVGQLDTRSTAAVGVVFPVMFMIQAFGFFFGHGSGNYIARELGARRKENAEIMASTGFLCSLLIGVVISVSGLFFVDELCVWLGSTPTILIPTREYLSIVLLGAPFMTASLTLNNQMRLQGNAALAMYGIVSGVLVNLLLDPLLIFGLSLGVRGAAMATVAGQLVGFSVLLIMSSKGENIKVALSKCVPTWSLIKEIVYGGSPSLSRQGLGCVAVILLNVAASEYGDEAIAAMSIVNRVTMFVMSAVVGLGQGFQPFCGFCYGAKLYDRLRQGFVFTLKFGTLFLVIFSVIGLGFSSQAISIFRDDPIVVKIGAVALCWQLFTYPLNAFVMVGNMMLQTICKPLRANILATARQGLFFIPLILLLPSWFGLLGVQMCQAWCDILSFIIAFPIMKSVFADMKKTGFDK